MRRTYLDAGVLIAAARGKEHNSEAALFVLEERDRIFLACTFLDFELVPQAILHGNYAEQRFYRKYLSGAERIDDLNAILRLAFNEASRSPVSGIDALHVAAASCSKPMS